MSVTTGGSIIPSRVSAIVLCNVLIAAFTGNASAAYTAAAVSGDWSTAATWTNGVPGVNDNATIGSGAVGATASATVTLSQNSLTGTLTLGDSAGTVGTLDVNGFSLGVTNLNFGSGGPSGFGAIARTGGGTLSVSATTTMWSPVTFSFVPGDTTTNLVVYNGATVTTAGSGNVTRTVETGNGTLNLGADLNLSSSLSLGGTLNANGHAITAVDSIDIGVVGAPSTITNRGPISTHFLSVGSSLGQGQTAFNLTPADSVNVLTLYGVHSDLPPGVSIPVLQLEPNEPGSPIYATATTSATSNVTDSVLIYPGCTLTLGADMALSSANYPNGSLTVNGTLNANGHAISSGEVILGGSGGTFGLVNRGPITTASLQVSSQNSLGQTTFTLTPADAVAALTLSGVNFAPPPGIQVRSLSLYSIGASPVVPATATISNGNVTDSISVGSGCTLTLGTDLVLTNSFGLSGTLDANGKALSAQFVSLSSSGGPVAILNRGPISTPNLTVISPSSNQVTFSLTAADNVTSMTLRGASTVLMAGVTVPNLSLQSSGGSVPIFSTATTSSPNNIASQATVFPGCSLNLGTDFAAGTIVNGGTLNANGHAITTPGSLVFGLSLPGGGPGAIQNQGLINVGFFTETMASQIRLNQPGDSINNMLRLTTNSNLTVGDALGQVLGLTLNGRSAGDLSIDPGSGLVLEVNGLASGSVFRWANPNSATNHIADLQALINGGEITFSYLNGGAYTLTSDGSYTYIAVPEPSTLLLTATAAGLLAAIRRRRTNQIRKRDISR
jgi:hypothetical protein